MKATGFRNGIKRVLAAILSTLIWLNVFSGALVYIGGFIAHADEPAQMYNIRTADEFKEYSIAYAQGYRNPKDVLNLSINEGSIVTGDGFISLGTQSRPFEGTLIISTGGIDVFHLFDCPLFNYVTTDMCITGAGTVKIEREQANDMPADGVLTSGALFANHVVAGTNAANWSIALMPLEGNGIPSTSFEGLIGDIAANCDVTVTFDNTTGLAVSASGNVGLICGTLGEGAKLTVTTAGSGGNISVTSSAGNAGGLVGEMKNGSTLKYNSANNSRVNSVTSANGYAGGVVGSADRITVEYASGVTDYAVSGTITGKTGSGGVFGKYVTDAVSSETFTLLNTYAIASGTSVQGTNNCCCGGVFGVLENNADSFTFDGNSETIAVSLSGGKYHGGVCGSYKAAALTETFTVQNTVTSLTASVLTNDKYTAGLIGKIDNSPAYINIHDVSCGVTGGLNGGLVGYAGTGGSFIDLTGNVAITGSSTLDAGLVANIPSGVLRLSGVFDFGGFASRSSAASGYLVKDRGRALIYALGDGEGNVGNWTFKRNTSPGIDDIHSWGEVIRCDGTKLKESDLFTVDMTAHTVTVKAAVTAMGSVTDFAKTALNIKLNTDADVGALKFESSTRSSTLLSGNLSLTSDIALTGTGLLGLARDDGGNAPFSGTFNGGGHTITFATGEKYGLQANGSALSANDKQGSIYQHAYTGLFAETNNATVQNVNLAGTYRLRPNVAGVRAAGVSAYATGGLNLSSVNVSLGVSEYVGGDLTEYFGGAVAVADGNGLNISVSNCNISPTVTDISSSGGDSSFFIGGAIGYVTTADEAAAAPSQTVSFTNSTLGLNYNKTGSADRASVFGAAIAGVANCRYVKDNRQISFSNVAVNIDVDNGRTKNRRFGAILGTDWYAADVTVNGVTVNADIAATAGSAADFGGLVRTATGHWDVQKISLTAANLAYPSAGGSTFGFVTNITSNKTPSTVNADGALYLDVDNRTVSGVNNYDISALTITGPTFTVFDEIAADSRFRTDADHVNDIVSNGNSVISITTTDNGLISSAGDTYYNKTAYGQSANGAVNANTRYYYNLAYARANTSTQKFKFLTWSAGIYAHSTLSSWFTVADSTFSGDLDMTGLSYYPVDLTKSVTFSGATLKLDNITMESRVNKAYSADGGSRTTRDEDSQHYLMHTAVFRNDPTSQISINNSMTLQGNVPKISDSFCGFLVAGELGDADNATAKLTATNIALDGAHIITDTGADLTTSAYAPLLVNKVGKNSNVTINGVAQSNTAYSGYASKYIASSLIGDVGYDTARAISLRFTNLKLDGRSAANSIGNMDTVYGTTKSLFSRATILNSFTYAGESSGSYNFEIERDWSGSTAVHNVTYGHEITNSVEYANKQKMYYGSDTYYTHPTVAQSTAEYDFSSGFMPYVYHAANATTAYNVADKTHELMVNVNVTAVIEGCGKYNDPYIIDNNDKLPIIAKIIANDTTVLGGGVQLYLPTDMTSYD
ncbi:MAG: hypothetical protein IKZ81_05295, partial [Clostridia bacterium]|nr:hypothetical protein [Clostridia bacterium]